ncbi:acyl-CoA synthetase [Myxococcota bacterium]|nr:acyl-CoA synthetase [Myxococcota bacterium]
MIRTEPRRLIVGVAGDARLAEDDPKIVLAEDVGRALVDAGLRVATGGLGGVMEAALRGARTSARYREGDTIALLPGHDPSAANAFADIVLATGLDLGRNLLVANTDALIAIGGGAGTLMEIAAAWQLRRPIVALRVDGWSGRLAGERLDARTRQDGLDEDRVHDASDAESAVRLVERLIPLHPKRHRRV